MDRLAVARGRGMLLAGALLIFASLFLLAFQPDQDAAAPPPPEATANSLVEGRSLLAALTPLPMTDILRQCPDRQPFRTPPSALPPGELPGAAAAVPERPKALPAITVAAPRTMPLPGSGSGPDQPDRWARAPSPEVAVEGRQPASQPGPTATATPRPYTPQPPTRIVAPAIGLDAQVVAMGWEAVWRDGRRVLEWQVPKSKAGWHSTSALAGQAGNTVLSGHRNIYAEVFRYVPDLEPGDEISLYAGDQVYVYTVAEKHVVQEVGVPESVRIENATWIQPTDDVRLTLVTCAPYGPPGDTHRVIIVARP